MSEAKKIIIGFVGGVVGIAVPFTLAWMLAAKGDEPVSRPQPIPAQQSKPVPAKPALVQVHPQPLLADLAASTNPFVQEDLVVFAGPRLGPFNVEKPALPIYLNESFQRDRSVGRDFSLVAWDVVRIVGKMFDGTSPPINKPIVCWIGAPLPLIDATSDHRFIFIRIALTNEDLRQRNYCRFAYQLSHEMGHLYLDPRRSNGLIETLSDSIAYQTLAELSHLWKSRPGGRDDITSYAPLFLTYREMKTAEKMKTLPPEMMAHLKSGRIAAVRSYLELQTQELDKSPYNVRGLALRSLAAEVFPQEKSWKQFVGIAGLTVPSPSQDGHYREGLPTQIERAPQSVRDALRTIGRH